MPKRGYLLWLRALTAHVFGATALFALARTTQASFALSDVYVVKVAAVYGLGTVVCLAFVTATHPYSRYGPANIVTMIRAMFVTLICGLIGEEPTAQAATFAAFVAVVAAVLDGADGRLARETGMTSRFGARFDMETDSFLVLVLAVLVWQYGKAGGWVLAIGLMRYVFVTAGYALPWLAGPLSPTLRGKAVAVVQMLALGFAIVPALPTLASTVVAALALAALAWSFAIDVRRLWRARRTSSAPIVR